MRPLALVAVAALALYLLADALAEEVLCARAGGVRARTAMAWGYTCYATNSLREIQLKKGEQK